MKAVETTYKQYVIKGDPNFPSLKRIRQDGSGAVPDMISGMYTSVLGAKKAIDFLESSKSEADANQAKPASRSKQLRKGADNGSESVEVSSGRNDVGAELSTKQGRKQTA